MLKLALGLFLAPVSAASLWAAAETMGHVAAHADKTFPFLIGFFGYFLLRLFAFRPMRVYVFGHELSHALAAWMSGARVFKFHVGEKNGHVDLSHSNAWIALAPYMVPIYAVGVILIYRFWMWMVPPDRAWRAFAHGSFLLAMGAALSFHLAHTAEAIGMRRQPDLDRAGGFVFSLAWIAAVNGFVLIVALKCLFPQVVLMKQAARQVWGLTAAFWGAAFDGLNMAVHKIMV